MSKKRLLIIGCGIIFAFMLLIPIPFQPPGNKRMIVDHTYQVYITPSCFEQATITNNLSETSWKEVKKTKYKAESTCTVEQLQPANQTLWVKLKEILGLVPSPWSW